MWGGMVYSGLQLQVQVGQNMAIGAQEGWELCMGIQEAGDECWCLACFLSLLSPEP